MRYSELITILNECATHCTYCTDECLDESNLSEMNDCIRTNLVCAEICTALSKILTLSYTDVGDLIKYCQRVCMTCATECRKHSHEHCQQCADICEKCSTACKEVLVKYESKN